MKNIPLEFIKEFISDRTEFKSWKRTAGRSTQEEARYLKIYVLIAQKLTSHTLYEIGKVVELDHASIIHHIKTGKGFLDVDIEFRAEYERLLKTLISYIEEIEERLKTTLNNILMEIDTENYTEVEKSILKQKLQESEF